MAGVLDSVDSRTQLVGENRLELLMFRLEGPQIYAINVFKVQEVQRMPKLTKVPKSHQVVVGVTHCRGSTIPVIDLSAAIGMAPVANRETANIIITEYNQTIQAFMVGGVDRIINMNWGEITPPPQGTGCHHYLTAITQVTEDIVEIIDVEKVLSEINAYNVTISEGVLEEGILEKTAGMHALVVDDSSVARNQAGNILKQLGITVHFATDGAKGLALLKEWADDGFDFDREFLLLVTDAEMPQMDGYRLTAEIRKNPQLKNMFITLHTSLSGSFNKSMTQKVGCDEFLSKFQPDELARVVQERVRVHQEQQELANQAQPSS